MDLSQFKHKEIVLKPNLIQLPPNQFQGNMQGAEEFNEVYRYVLENYGGRDTIVWTPSGGISYAKGNLRFPCWGVRADHLHVELVLLCGQGMFRFNFGYIRADDSGMRGSTALYRFREMLAEDGVDLDEYALPLDEAKAVKAEIHEPHIKLVRAVEGKVYDNAYHLDLNSAYASNIVKEYPEFRPTIERLFNGRKAFKEYKDILNMAFGAMQSLSLPFVRAKWANISKAGVNGTYYQIADLVEELRAVGYNVLATNTDGIWYSDPFKMGDYRNHNYGAGLGQYKTDHHRCRIRFKSVGAYEYIEDGKYTPVVRGVCRYDRIKPRTEWQWGDIFRNDADAVIFEFNPERGIELL